MDFVSTFVCMSISKRKSLHPEDGGIVIRNVGYLPQQYTATQPRRPLLHAGGNLIPRNMWIMSSQDFWYL